MSKNYNAEVYNTIGDAIGEFVENQPFYRRYANTINALAGGVISGLVALAATVPATDTFDFRALATTAVAAIGASLAARLTKNGLSHSTASELTNRVSPAVAEVVHEAVIASEPPKPQAPSPESHPSVDGKSDAKVTVEALRETIKKNKAKKED